jgi:hypothetical protein
VFDPMPGCVSFGCCGVLTPFSDAGLALPPGLLLSAANAAPDTASTTAAAVHKLFLMLTPFRGGEGSRAVACFL